MLRSIFTFFANFSHLPQPLTFVSPRLLYSILTPSLRIFTSSLSLLHTLFTFTSFSHHFHPFTFTSSIFPLNKFSLLSSCFFTLAYPLTTYLQHSLQSPLLSSHAVSLHTSLFYLISIFIPFFLCPNYLFYYCIMSLLHSFYHSHTFIA